MLAVFAIVPGITLTDGPIIFQLACSIPIANGAVLILGAALRTCGTGKVLVAFASGSAFLPRDTFTMTTADFPSRARACAAARSSNVSIFAVTFGLLGLF